MKKGGVGLRGEGEIEENGEVGSGEGDGGGNRTEKRKRFLKKKSRCNHPTQKRKI